MKYLKTFESEIDFTKLKKYIIVQEKNKSQSAKYILNVIEIFKIRQYPDKIKVKQLYSYDDKLKKEIFTDTFIFEKMEKYNILYQSDNIEECINILPTLGELNKYNI